MALDDPNYIPVNSDKAWDSLISEYVSILQEKQRYIRAGFTALRAEHETQVRRLIWKVKVVKVLRAEAAR